jgi:hypothetical protein
MIRLSVLAFSGSTVICVIRVMPRCKLTRTAAIWCLRCDANGHANDANGRGSDVKTVFPEASLVRPTFTHAGPSWPEGTKTRPSRRAPATSHKARSTPARTAANRTLANRLPV